MLTKSGITVIISVIGAITCSPLCDLRCVPFSYPCVQTSVIFEPVPVGIVPAAPIYGGLPGQHPLARYPQYTWQLYFPTSKPVDSTTTKGTTPKEEAANVAKSISYYLCPVDPMSRPCVIQHSVVPSECFYDEQCPALDSTIRKCCYDNCLQHKTCKPAISYP